MTNTSKLLIIGFVWPEPESSAAGSRMMQLINYFQNDGWSITFASTARPTEYMENLSKQGIETRSIELNNEKFDSFIRTLSPDLVLFDRFMTEEQFGWRVHAQCPDAIRILDTEDLHFLRKAREDCVKNENSFKESYLVSDLSKREIASIYRCDLSLIISEAEMDLLKNFFKIDSALLFYLPFMLDEISDQEKRSWPTFNERTNFLSIGNFLHKPNRDSIVYLKDAIWPHIRKQLPEAEVHIYGAYPDQQIEQLNDSENGFVIKGRADNAFEVMKKARICLAPIRFGAGLKGKLAEAMQCGTPSITTTIGAEGLNGDMDWSGAIKDEPAEFADAAVTLYLNELIWSDVQRRGELIIKNRFSSSIFSKKFGNRIQDLTRNLKKHRLSNFNGSMLMHHTMASTRFMSRWIEEKNK